MIVSNIGCRFKFSIISLLSENESFFDCVLDVGDFSTLIMISAGGGLVSLSFGRWSWSRLGFRLL
jgi:hypothetical protein